MQVCMFPTEPRIMLKGILLLRRRTLAAAAVRALQHYLSLCFALLCKLWCGRGDRDRMLTCQYAGASMPRLHQALSDSYAVCTMTGR